MMFDGRAFGAEIVDVVKGYVGRALDPILRRLDDLERIRPEKGEPGLAGRDGVDGKDGRDGIDGKDGASVGRDDILAAIASDPSLIAEAVAKHLEANPPLAGRDGRDGIDGKDGLPGRDGIDGAPGRNGLDVKGLFRAEGNRLVAVMSDGTVIDLGVFVGKDGKDGAPGRDGIDGLGFEDMIEVLEDGGRTIVRRYARGEVVREFRHSVPALIYRGVYKAEHAYEAGDTVTWGGSIWHCGAATTDKPGEGSEAWTLAVKRGQNGRDGASGEKGEPGREGRPGRDLTQLGFDGGKH